MGPIWANLYNINISLSSVYMIGIMVDYSIENIVGVFIFFRSRGRGGKFSRTDICFTWYPLEVS